MTAGDVAGANQPFKNGKPTRYPTQSKTAGDIAGAIQLAEGGQSRILVWIRIKMSTYLRKF